MKTAVKYVGLAFWIFGLIGGCGIVDNIFGIDWFNVVTKDQVMVVIGMTWFYMEYRA